MNLGGGREHSVHNTALPKLFHIMAHIERDNNFPACWITWEGFGALEEALLG